MHILFVGDVVGSMGRDMIKEYVPKLKEKYRPQMTIINGENAAGGKGITEKIYRSFLEIGAQAITMGNHTWDNREIFEFIDQAKYLVRPANFPENNPGKGMVFVKINDIEVAVINLQGRTFMNPSDDPFIVIDGLVEEAKNVLILFLLISTERRQVKSKQWDGI